MTEELPEGWAVVPLGEYAQVVMGQSPPGSTYNQERKGLPFFQGKADFGRRSPVARVWCSAPTRTAKPGDVLVSVRAPVGPTNIADQVCAFGRGLAALRPAGGTPSEWILYSIGFLQEALEHASSGSTFTAINRGVLESLEIAVAPLPEQRRIVEKIESLLAQVDAASNRLARVQLLIKAFRQAVLQAACEGRLTGTRGDESRLPSEQRSRRLGDCPVILQTGPFGSQLHRGDYDESGVPLVNPMHITADGRIAASRKAAVASGKADELARFRLKRGDVVVARRGELGRAAVVSASEEGYLCGTGSMLLRSDPTHIDADFLCMFMRSPATRENLEATSVGSTMTNLNQRTVGDLAFPVFALEHQREIVRRVEALFAVADVIDRRLEVALTRAEKLPQAILTKAFSGQLVPTEAELARYEGRSYETAEKLLARIRNSVAARSLLDHDRGHLGT